MRSLLLSAILLASGTLFAQTGMEQLMQAGGNMEMVDDNDPFVPGTFEGSFTMEMSSLEDGKPAMDAPMLVKMTCSPEKTLMAFTAGEGNEMKMLTDLKGKWTYLMMEVPGGGKMAMKSHKKKIVYTGDEKAATGTVNVTQETKTIDGHVCTKVTGTSEEGSWTAWVAKDLKVDFGAMMGGVPQAASGEKAWQEVKGFPLEMEMRDKTGKTSMVMHMKDLRVGPVPGSVFSLDGYKVMEMPEMGR